MGKTAAEATALYTGDGRATDVLAWALNRYHPHIAIACSFQHTVLIDLARRIRPDIRVFSIDTGRLPEETYECAREVERRFGLTIEWYLPDHREVEALMRRDGPCSFRESVTARKHCCAVRKVAPLKRALAGLDAWITGLRNSQTGARAGTAKVGIDTAHGGIVKVNPLADWSDADIRDYARRHDLPRNRLLDAGYPSIGCACCTRPVAPGADPRSGRWWWEQEAAKECGLHVRDWQI